jgi:hypothetical protein
MEAAGMAGSYSKPRARCGHEGREVWLYKVSAKEAARLAAICERYGVSYTIDGVPGKPRPVPVDAPAMTLRRWAGLRHATLRERYQNRVGCEAGFRVLYRCLYDGSQYGSGIGPIRRNPLDAMEAAKAQDEARRAKARSK